MKRIKVGSKGKHSIEHSLNTAFDSISNLMPIVKELIGRFDTEILQDILQGNNETRYELESTMKSNIEKLSSNLMKDEFKSKLKDALSKFDNTTSKMTQLASGILHIIPLDNWVIQNGEIRINDYDNLIEEASSIYIESKEGIELYEKLENLAKELNNISDLVRKYNILAVADNPRYRGLIEANDKGVYQLQGEFIANVVKEVYK